MAIDPRYDKVYEHTHNFTDYPLITATTHFETHLEYNESIGTLQGTVKASIKTSDLYFVGRIYFPPEYIVGDYNYLEFWVSENYNATREIRYLRPNKTTGKVDGRVRIELYGTYDFVHFYNLYEAYSFDCSNLFVQIDASAPTLDMLNVTTDYLGTIPSVDIKASHPYLKKVTYNIKDSSGNLQSASINAANEVAEGVVAWEQQFWESGHSYEYELKANTELKSYTVDTGTVVFDSKVVDVAMSNLQQMNTGQTQQTSYTLLKPDGAVGPFKYPGVTYSSSNTSVATINSSGLITAVAYGTATITVVSDDPWPETVDPLAEHPSDSKTLIVTSTPGAFPTLETDYTRITKGDIEDFLSAEEILKAELNPSSWTTITFDGYSHSVFTIYEMIGDIIENLQNLTSKYLANNPSSTTAQQLNRQAQGCTIDRENSLYPTGVTAWRVTFRTISQTLIGLADAIL